MFQQFSVAPDCRNVPETNYFDANFKGFLQRTKTDKDWKEKKILENIFLNKQVHFNCQLNLIDFIVISSKYLVLYS